MKLGMHGGIKGLTGVHQKEFTKNRKEFTKNCSPIRHPFDETKRDHAFSEVSGINNRAYYWRRLIVRTSLEKKKEQVFKL